jgi:hypothetical protein
MRIIVMKSAKKRGQYFGIAGSYTSERLLEGLNDHWHRFNERTREVVETILRANVGRASEAIDGELAKKIEVYDLRPRLKWDPMSAEGWSVIWSARLSSPGVEFDNNDHQLITYLFEASAHGELRRFRRCAWGACSRWFFQRRDDQLFHSTPCKLKARGASPEYREKQRKIMRDRYREQKARDEKVRRLNELMLKKQTKRGK